VDYGEFQLSYRYGGITIPRVPLQEPLALECAHFVDSITQRRPARSDGWSGLRVVQVLEAADRSLQNASALEPVHW
jgi:predicted dehydrogenase